MESVWVQSKKNENLNRIVEDFVWLEEEDYRRYFVEFYEEMTVDEQCVSNKKNIDSIIFFSFFV